MTLNRIFAEFRKSADGKVVVLKNDDGTIQVEGVASSEALDAQGEVVKASAIAAALPEYMKFPALREMHQPLAAGKTLAADVSEDGKTYITAKVVDPVAIRKIEEGVYAGFSIGGTVPPGGRSKNNPKIIEAIKLVEISLVDRPANPEAVFTLVKLETDPAVTTTQSVEQVVAAKVEPPAPAKPAEPPTKTKKSMRHVAWGASLCDELSALASDAMWEAEFKGEDDSAVADQLKGVAKSLCDALKAMLDRETEALFAAKGMEALSILASPGTLKKSEAIAVLARSFLVGARRKAPELPELVDLRKRAVDLEAATKQAGETLKTVAAERDEMKKKLADATLALKAKGVPKDPKFVESVAKVEALESALKEAQDATEKAGDALKKVLGERDELKKQRDQFEAALAVQTDKAKEQLGEVAEERDALQAQLVEKVTALAQAEVKLKTKGVLKTVAVEKERDGFVEKDDKAKPPEGTPERALYELKKVQAKGGRPLTLGGLLPASQENGR